MPTKRVFVGMFPEEPSQATVEEAFADIGTCVIARVQSNRNKEGRFLGSVHVEFKDIADSIAAVRGGARHIAGARVRVTFDAPRLGSQNIPPIHTHAECQNMLPPGLRYISEFITKEEERAMLAHIDADQWQTSLGRRTQQRGKLFSYTTHRLEDLPPPLDQIPSYYTAIVARIKDRFSPIFPCDPDQCIVNEYVGDQGINPHIDKPELFDESIVSLTLAGAAGMVFDPVHTRQGHQPLGLLGIEFSFLYHTLWRGSFPCRNDVG